jgi:hypothetical protein
MKRKNYSTKIFNSNKILGDTSMVTLNKENLYFLETEELSADDVACDSQSLRRMRDTGLTMDSTIQEIIEVITAKGFKPSLIETKNIDVNCTLEHLVSNVDGFEEWEIFENIVLYTGEDIELRLENIGDDED